ncbi:outer membrane beta-barrel protein [uncultured Bdellovibrio sp.]|uniref:outer membrane beta-barrel protein n=1 Tax=Bdellovibrio sp. HCB-162 TaxID=3394234 RepID=UPI0025E8357C|nr:outer membrane beta-barrel protein [uncultured Bdellovibrio sp.]
MFSKVFAAAIVLVSVSAHAADSEFFFQSKAGQSDLTPRIGYISTKTKPKGGTTETKFSGLYKTGVSYEYGINEMFSIEGSLLFSSYENDNTPKTKVSGLEDPHVVLKGTSNMGTSNLRYGLDVGLSVEKMKVKSNNEVNAATGGFSFTPYVGMDTEAAGGVIGGRLSYAVLLERTIEIEGFSDAKLKEGNTLGLSAFYETVITDVVLGGSLNYYSHASTKDQDGDEAIKAYNTLGLSLYSRIPFGTWALIPRLDYDFSSSEHDTYNIINLSAAARFTF